MLLLIEIGNSNLKIAYKDKDFISKVFRIKSDNMRSSDEYAVIIKAILNQNIKKNYNIDKCIISSVVPSLTFTISNFVQSYFEINPLIVNYKLESDIFLEIDSPDLLGADRFVNAVATVSHYRVPAINIDFGTALVIDYIDHNKVFKGGLIMPGVQTALNVLSTATAQLPRINLDKPEFVVGKNTISAIQSGIYNGYTSLVNGLVEKIQTENSKVDNIIITGGMAEFFQNNLKFPVIYDRMLTIKGLIKLSETNDLK